ncbi:MAG: hypothetical protein ACREEB_08665 [Caulobacteraceae bacterium]
MSDLDPDRATETRTTADPLGPRTEVTRTETRSSGAAWWAVALVGVALIAAVTYVITRQPSSANTDAAVAAASQQLQTQSASQQAQSAAAQAQSAAQSAAQASQSAASRAASAPPPASDQAPPAQSDQGGGPPQQ